MPRYFVELAYNGKEFYGWQKQPNDISVQETIESCLSQLHSNTPINVTGCGRTDTGVHAKYYVLHVDLPEINNIEQFVYKLNKMLPDRIAVFSMKQTTDEFHARFGAKERTYRYFIHQEKNPFICDQSWYMPRELDIDKMNEACKHLLGTQDFTSLSKLHTDVKTNICTVRKAEWKTNGEGLYFEITADRFLRNMVRATVGTLMDVGFEKIQPNEIREILAKKDRQAASVSVPAHGLFLWNIIY